MSLDMWVKRTLMCVIGFGILQVLFGFQDFWLREKPHAERRPMMMKLAVLEEGLNVTSVLKQWPAISSFRAWTPNPNLKPYSCEAYFGNGFIDEHIILKPRCSPPAEIRWEEKGACGSFRCFYSETLKTSICEGKNVVMNPEKIAMSRGGETIERVFGRDEGEELPVYSEGAFQVKLPPQRYQKVRRSAPVFDEVSLDTLMPKGKINSHTLRSLLLNLRTVDFRSPNCSHRVREPTVLVTRFEYANLFHTSTDWYSAYVSSRVVGLEGRPRIVFLDGHCESPMDDGWKAMFTSVTYAKHFKGTVCFDHAIFAPLGYDIPIFKYIESTLNCQGCSVEEEDGTQRKMARMREFGEVFAKSFENLTPAKSTEVEKQAKKVTGLFVRREDYLAHPRHSGKLQSRLSNEEEAYQALKEWAGEKSKKLLNVTVMNGLLAHMNLEEQIVALNEADVLVGAHGAGLTHLLFADPSTIVFELLSPMYRRPHFATMSFWMGMDYRVLNMEDSFADIDQVKTEMDKILEDVTRRKGIQPF